MDIENCLNDRGLIFISILKKNKKEIPKEFQANKEREMSSSLYRFSNELTLVSVL